MDLRRRVNLKTCYAWIMGRVHDHGVAMREWILVICVVACIVTMVIVIDTLTSHTEALEKADAALEKADASNQVVITLWMEYLEKEAARVREEVDEEEPPQ